MPPIKLDEQSQELLMNFGWVKHKTTSQFAEQISVLEKEKLYILFNYLSP